MNPTTCFNLTVTMRHICVSLANRNLYFLNTKTTSKYLFIVHKECLAPKFQKSLFHTTACMQDVPSLLVTKSEMKSAQTEKVQKISKAMKAYMDRAKQHDEFIKEQEKEYETGKRHLANMMGVDTEMLTRDYIDKAIEYLMPSGLFDKKARPMMKPPSEVFPKRKAAEFDYSGRPHNSFFYTGRPEYYRTLNDIVGMMNDLDLFEDKMIKQGIVAPPEKSKLELDGSEWIKKEDFEKMILESIDDNLYSNFITTLNRLAEHPYSFRVKDFIMKYRVPLKVISLTMEIPPLQYLESDQPYITREGFRKTSRSQVTVFGNGSGKFLINGKDIQYFSIIQDREQVIFPLQFTNLLGKVDVETTVYGGGESGQSGAVRHGLSLALCSFVSKDVMEKMRLAGLLQRDRKTRERKKCGQKGARAKYTWKKR